MPDREGGPSPSAQLELSRDRCPSCNGPLRFPNNRREGLCPACGIFVEILEPVAPDDAAAERAADDVPTRRELAAFDLQFEQSADEDLDAEIEQMLELVLAEPEGPPQETVEVVEEGEPPPQTVEESLATEPIFVDEAPGLVEPTEAVGMEAMETVVAEPPAIEAEATAARTKVAAAGTPRRWHRVVFHLGAVLVVLGGSGLALGSLLHDVFRVPVVGTAYEAFGPVNVAAALLGSLALASGVAAMAVAARIGRPRRRPVPGG